MNSTQDITLKDIKFQALTDAEIYKQYTDYDSKDPWNRFKELEEIKFFKGDSLFPYLAQKNEYHVYFCAIFGRKIVGMLKFKVGGHDSMFHPGWKNWVNFISILPEFQNKKISRELIKMLFEYAKLNSLSVLMSGYTEDGFTKAKKIFAKESKNYSVEFLDDRDHVEF